MKSLLAGVTPVSAHAILRLRLADGNSANSEAPPVF